MGNSQRKSRSSFANKLELQRLKLEEDWLLQDSEAALFERAFIELQEVQNQSAWVLGVALGVALIWLELFFMWAISSGV